MTSSPQSQRSPSFFGTWKNLDLSQLRRHGLSVLSALVATGLAIYAIWHPDHQEQDAILRMLATIALGIPLFLLPSLIFEQPQQSKRRLQATFALLLLMIAYIAFSRGWSNVFFFYKSLQGFVLCHLLVSLAPYFRDRTQDEKEFWSANWFLLNRFHMAATQSVLLLIGMLIALLSIKHLFGLEIAGEVSGTVAAVMIFFVSVILFIGSLGELKEVVEPAEILKRLVRTVLTPLAFAYFAILYAYGLKVAIAREWPRGGIGLLVSGLAMIITLSYVIMRPLATSDVFGQKLKAFWSWSFRLLLGPVLLLMLGLGRRVSDYGWTEQRAALGYLALWMFGIGVFYWYPNRRRLVAIPLSLAVLLLVTWFGPLSPSFIGKESQSGRLQTLLSKDRATLSFEDKKSINSILQSLCEAYGVDVMAKAARVTLRPTAPAKLGDLIPPPLTYGSTNFARLCDDDYRDGTVAPGPLSQALTQLNVPKIDRYASTETKEDLSFYRPSPDDLSFGKYEIAQFAFDDWRRTGNVADDSFIEQEHGRLKIRMKRVPASLEWETAPGVWRKLDLGPVSKFMMASKDLKLNPAEYGAGLQIVDSDRNRRIELQIVSARFIEGDLNQIGSLHFTSLVENSRPAH
jgi:hypothetical protein